METEPSEEYAQDRKKDDSNGIAAKEGTGSCKEHVPHGAAPAKQEYVSPPKAAQSSKYVPRPPPGLQAPAQHVGTGTPEKDPININNIPSRPPPGLASPPPGMGSLPPQHQPTNPVQQLIKPGPPPGMPPPFRTPTVTKGTAPSNLQKTPISSILPARPDSAENDPTARATTPSKPVKVRRTQTRCEQQPGRLFANDVPAPLFNSSPKKSLISRPRSELTARWALPLPYLRNRALRRFEEQRKSLNGGPLPPENLTIRDALKYLAVGLFRRGAMDSGSQSSIVSKEILASSDSTGKQASGRPSNDYFFNVDQRNDSVYGNVPFYAPRTPGNVVFRLYFEDEPHVTLATGPCIHVVPADGDIDSVLRFILSNFKSKKTNGFSSMNSLASVLELFAPRQNNNNERFFDGAGRFAWGCICESRKVVEQAALTYMKKKTELKEKLEAERIKEQLPDLKSLGIHAGETTEPPSGVKEGADANVNCTHTEEDSEKDKNAATTGDVKAKWSSEEYSNERKWREIQLVYASVLKVRTKRCSRVYSPSKCLLVAI